MKTLLGSLLASLFLVAFLGGCDRHRKAQSKEDLEARLGAALNIVSSSDRDSALASVAADAADLGAGDVAKKAVMGIVTSSDRDDAAHNAALKLAKAGKGAEAKDIAEMIVSSSTRDATLKKLAQGAE